MLSRRFKIMFILQGSEKAGCGAKIRYWNQIREGSGRESGVCAYCQLKRRYRHLQ